MLNVKSLLTGTSPASHHLLEFPTVALVEENFSFGGAAMRFRSLALMLLAFAGMATLFMGFAEAQAPAPAPAAKAAGGQAPAGSLAQVMRGILFPNSNVVFFAQGSDPAAVKPAADPTTAIDPLAGSFGGWAAVENSGIALSEAANLLTIPGRLCSNGRPVPLKNPDWPKFVQELRTAGMSVYKAAQSKNQDKVSDAADAVTAACSDCHTKYRDVAGGVPDRCK
jgi:hypothetical protein